MQPNFVIARSSLRSSGDVAISRTLLQVVGEIASSACAALRRNAPRNDGRAWEIAFPRRRSAARSGQALHHARLRLAYLLAMTE